MSGQEKTGIVVVSVGDVGSRVVLSDVFLPFSGSVVVPLKVTRCSPYTKLTTFEKHVPGLLIEPVLCHRKPIQVFIRCPDSRPESRREFLILRFVKH